MNPDTYEQPLIPAFSPNEGEKENCSLVFQQSNASHFGGSWSCHLIPPSSNFGAAGNGRGRTAVWFSSIRIAWFVDASDKYKLCRTVCALLTGLGLITTRGAQSPNSAPVGRTGSQLITPVNQIVEPAGRFIDLPGLRPQTIALSPNGKLLAVAGKTSEVLILNPQTGEIIQRVPLPPSAKGQYGTAPVSPNILEPDLKGQASYTGLIFSHDGRKLFLSNVEGDIKVFAVAQDGAVKALRSLALPPANAPRREAEIPAGLALSADDKILYVCGNLSNRLLEFEAETGRLLRAFEVGVAPYEVVLYKRKAYVSNWGGGRPRHGDLTGPAGRGTTVRVDPVRHIAKEGSITVLEQDASNPERALKTEIAAQLHSSALALSPNGRYLVCANAASDNLTIVDTRNDAVIETIWAKQNPSDLFGASPNALCFSADGKTLYVANGTQNAIAVISFSPKNRGSKLLGLIPVGWFPGALALDAAHNTLCVANIKGHPVQSRYDAEHARRGFNSHHFFGSLSLVPIPTERELLQYTKTVYQNYHHERLAAALEPARSNQPLRPVPERIGEPSPIQHVIYVIKENRTYDQVLGDIRKGNGDASLCVFGQTVTPNQHKLANDFVLLDNTYCCAILSADGHQWSTTAFATDYLEKSFASWPRSYPDGMGEDESDALAYAPTGFIWDNAVRHHVSVWNFGEFEEPKCGWAKAGRKGTPGWTNFWNEFVRGEGEVRVASRPCVESMRPFTDTNAVGWDLAVPDQWRSRHITNQLAAWERAGEMPRLVLICLPDDHTSGAKAGFPTPAAQVADNDLAFGQIVEAVSHSKFWKSSAIFAIEDDPQAGWDHVSGYRTTAYVLSPWAKRGQVVSTQYNTTSLIRTMEQILGLPPMNQFDASALPMFECFTNEPDFTPFSAVPNEVALDQLNPPARKVANAVLRRDAILSARLPLDAADQCPEDTLNRILWRATKGPSEPYPAWAVSQVEDKD
jgi:DNA-binding beta-propeller fold protein YncE